MKKQLEQYFGCNVKITEYKNKLQIPIFMEMRNIQLVEFGGVKFSLVNIVRESKLTIAAMKKQQNCIRISSVCTKRSSKTSYLLPILWDMAYQTIWDI